MKRMLKKLIAILLVGTLIIPGDALVPGTGAAGAEKTQGELLQVDYREAHADLQSAAEEVMADTVPEDYDGIVVTGKNTLTGADFAYLNTAWRHASVMDLGDIHVNQNAMGVAYYGDGEGTEQIIGSQTEMASSSRAVQVETLTLPDTLQSLDQGALMALPNLKELVIPDSVTQIGSMALFDLPALKKLSYHGTGVTSLDSSILYMYRPTVVLTLDLSNASGLKTVTMEKGKYGASSIYVKDFDFTGCTSLNSVTLDSQPLDFSGGKQKKWRDSFDGTVTLKNLKPMLTIEAESMKPLAMGSEFPGAPALKGLLLDGTDVLAEDAVLPDWIDSSYIDIFKDSSKVSVHYINPSGVEGDTLDTSIGGVHTIRWMFDSIQNPWLHDTTYELPVEVIISEEQKIKDVYLDPDKTGGNGTEENPVSTISSAFGYLKAGGTLHLKGDVTLPKGIVFPSNLTIVGTEAESKPTLTLSENLALSSNLTIDGVQLAAAKDLSIYANGHTLTFGEHMADTPVNTASRAGEGGQVSIYGGGTDAVTEDTRLVLKGGNFANVYGGGYIGGGHGDEVGTDAGVAGDTHIEISGDVVIENVYGGGRLAGAPGLAPANVNVGNTYIEMSGGKVDTLYGGGYSHAAGSASAGSTHLSVTGGTIQKLYGGGYADYPGGETEAKTENTEILLAGTAEVQVLYGGGYVGGHTTGFVDSDNNVDVTGNVKLTIQDTASATTVYGGGYVFDDPDASARVGGNVDIFYQGGSVSRIYGTGKYDKYENDEPTENAGVGGNVTIHAAGGDLSRTDLSGKVSDGGTVTGEAVINIQGYGTDRDNPQKVSTLSHFDNLILDNSHILFPANIVPNLSCDAQDGRNIEMKNNSSMTFGHSVSDTFKVNNLTTEGDAAIVMHVSGTDSANPLTVNGIVSVSQPIVLKLTGTGGREPAVGDKVFVTDNEVGNDSLLSSKFSLQNEEFKLIKKSGALVLTSLSNPEEEEQDPPRGLTGVAPSGYGKADGAIQGMTEQMEYALNPVGPFMPWQEDSMFKAGTYYVRYARNEEKMLLASNTVEVTIPEGQHTITYQVENGNLGDAAPQKVAHGDSFSFQYKAKDGYQLDWEKCSSTSGTLSHEGENFTVENVTEDVTVTIIATEIPGMVKIKKQPHDVTVRAGHPAVFEIMAEGEPEIRYQWQADKGRGFSNIAGETNPTLTTEEAKESANGYRYRCVVSNAYGSVTSATVTLWVIEEGETVAAQEKDNGISGITVQTQAEIGALLPFTAYGAGMDNTQPAQGDTRFVPLFWTTAMENGSWVDAPYSAIIRTSLLSQGDQTLSVTFGKQRYNGAEWETMGIEDVKTVTFRLKKKEESGGQNPDDGDSGNQGSGDQNSDDGGSGNQSSGGQDSDDKGSGNQGSGGQNLDNGGSGNQGSGGQNLDNGDSDTKGSSDAGNSAQGKSGQKVSGKKTSDRSDGPDTGDRTPVEFYATMTMVSGFAYLIFLLEEKGGMTEQKKKKLIDSLIVWAKKGGRFRRTAAIVMIFVLLVYYHAIGKYMLTEKPDRTGQSLF